MEGASTENAAAPVGVAAPATGAADIAAVRIEGTVVDSAEPTVPPTGAPEAAVEADQVIDDAVPRDGEDGDTGLNVTPEERRSILEVIAETGKFWHEWSFLRSLLSLQLKQVLAEYPEAQMTGQEEVQQRMSLVGETYSELVSRLNDALLRFEEGPPFTLQRICEILLDPKGTYTKLSKLALALEKNLLVTSTLTKCTGPYPAAHGLLEITENSGAADVVPERAPEHAEVPNGTEHIGGDGDEEMADAEAEASGSRDVEMQDEKPDQPLDVNPDATSGVVVAIEAVTAAEPTSNAQT